MARGRIGKARTHIVCLLCGAAAYASFFFIHDPQWLILSEIGVGIAWASILAMPYAILASSLPQRKLGIYMGLFNIFIVVPQLLVATVMGSIMKAFFPERADLDDARRGGRDGACRAGDDPRERGQGVSDEAEIGAVIDEMYAMISGPAGPRDWSRQRNCFLPEARQVRTWVDDRAGPT